MTIPIDGYLYGVVVGKNLLQGINFKTYFKNNTLDVRNWWFFSSFKNFPRNKNKIPTNGDFYFTSIAPILLLQPKCFIMHENLKYTLKLDQQIKPFRSFTNKNPNVEKDRAEISDWQAIYADIKYDTHYLVYAKFLGKNKSSGFEVSKIQLYIQNYSGNVSLGLVDYSDIVEVTMQGDDPDHDPRYPNRKKYKFQFALKGLAMTKQTHSFILKKKLILNDGDIIMTRPVILPVDTKLSKIFNAKNRKKSNFVDELFMKRFGSNIFVSDLGKKRLLELYAMKKGFVTKKDLIAAGIPLKDIGKVSTKGYKLDNRIFEPLDTPKYPCIPIYSICEIK